MFAGQPTRKEATVFFPERFSSEMQYEQKQHEQNHDYNQVHFSRKSAAYGVGICFESSPNQSLRVAQLEVGCSAYRSGVIEVKTRCFDKDLGDGFMSGVENVTHGAVRRGGTRS
eukprot:2419141-Rhodomonas_salina.3